MLNRSTSFRYQLIDVKKIQMSMSLDKWQILYFVDFLERDRDQSINNKVVKLYFLGDIIFVFVLLHTVMEEFVEVNQISDFVSYLRSVSIRSFLFICRNFRWVQIKRRVTIIYLRISLRIWSSTSIEDSHNSTVVLVVSISRIP